MASIRVLLLENIPSLGAAGDIVVVAEGYARNDLFPHGKAALASPEVERQRKQVDVKQAVKKQTELEQLQALASVMDHTELILQARVKEGNDIFGKIGAAQIVSQLNKETKLKLKPKAVELEHALTQLGTHPVTVNLSPDVVAHIKVTIIPDPKSLPKVHDEE